MIVDYGVFPPLAAIAATSTVATGIAGTITTSANDAIS